MATAARSCWRCLEMRRLRVGWRASLVVVRSWFTEMREIKRHEVIRREIAGQACRKGGIEKFVGIRGA